MCVCVRVCSCVCSGGRAFAHHPSLSRSVNDFSTLHSWLARQKTTAVNNTHTKATAVGRAEVATSILACGEVPPPGCPLLLLLLLLLLLSVPAVGDDLHSVSEVGEQEAETPSAHIDSFLHFSHGALPVADHPPSNGSQLGRVHCVLAEAVHAALTPFVPHVAHAAHGSKGGLSTPEADQVTPSSHLAFGGLHSVSVVCVHQVLTPFVHLVHAVHGDSPVVDQVEHVLPQLGAHL